MGDDVYVHCLAGNIHKCAYAQTYTIVRCKYVQFIVCQVCLIKRLKKMAQTPMQTITPSPQTRISQTALLCFFPISGHPRLNVNKIVDGGKDTYRLGPEAFCPLEREF